MATQPPASPHGVSNASSFAQKLLTAPLTPFLAVVNKLMERHPGDYTAIPPEGRDRIDRFLGGYESLVGQPGGTRIQTPLFSPSTGFIHTGLGLQPTGGMVGGGALIAPGLRPGPGISRDDFITHLRGNEQIPLTPAVQRFLDAIEQTSRGHGVGLGDFDPDVEDIARHLGAPLSGSGVPTTGVSLAHPPLGLHGRNPAWLSDLLSSEQRPMAGISPGVLHRGVSLNTENFGNLFNPGYRQALIEHLLNIGSHVGGIKPGTENN